MSRMPSAETQLKSLKREWREIVAKLKEAQNELTFYRGRASKAEAEAAEWKKRFDILLSREPSSTAGAKHE